MLLQVLLCWCSTDAAYRVLQSALCSSDTFPKSQLQQDSSLPKRCKSTSPTVHSSRQFYTLLSTITTWNSLPSNAATFSHMIYMHYPFAYSRNHCMKICTKFINYYQYYSKMYQNVTSITSITFQIYIKIFLLANHSFTNYQISNVTAVYLASSHFPQYAILVHHRAPVNNSFLHQYRACTAQSLAVNRLRHT